MVLVMEVGSSRFDGLENSFWKRLWTCRKRAYAMMVVVMMMVMIMICKN